MTVLSDQDIARELGYGELDVTPIDLDKQLQPASLDIRLGNKIGAYDFPQDIVVDPKYMNPEDYLVEHEIEESGFIIEPDEFYLADTVEYFSIPDYLEGELTGRSSIGRLGVEIHKTAGLFDPGFEGQGVLEITSSLDTPIALYPGMRVGQIVFQRLETPSNNSYNSEDNKYQGQEGAQSSRIDEDFE